MAATTTLKTLLEDLVEETGLGTVLPSCTGTTTQLTLANAYAAGPFLAQRFARGSAILTTAGTAINEATFVDTYTPPTGVITHTPLVSGTYTSAILCHFGTGVDHPDRLKEAINRALTRRCRRKVRMPFTRGGDGADLSDTISDWTLSNCTAEYRLTEFDDGGLDRFISITNTGSNGYATTGDVWAREGEIWDFIVTRANFADGQTARITVRDTTNSTTITPTYTVGSATSSSRAYTVAQGYFTVPDDCSIISFRLGCDQNGAEYGYGPIIAWPRGIKQFSVSPNVRSVADIGNFYRLSYEQNTTDPIPAEMGNWSDYLASHGTQEGGYSPVVYFDTAPQFPLYYEAFVSHQPLTSLTPATDVAAATAVNSERVLAWAKYELRKMIYERETDPEKKRQAKVLALEAKKSADRYEFNTTDIVTVAGRR